MPIVLVTVSNGTTRYISLITLPDKTSTRTLLLALNLVTFSVPAKRITSIPQKKEFLFIFVCRINEWHQIIKTVVFILNFVLVHFHCLQASHSLPRNSVHLCTYLYLIMLCLSNFITLLMNWDDIFNSNLLVPTKWNKWWLNKKGFKRQMWQMFWKSVYSKLSLQYSSLAFHFSFWLKGILFNLHLTSLFLLQMYRVFYFELGGVLACFT